MKKRMMLLSMLIVSAFTLSDAVATPTLPVSSHYQGTSHYSVPTAAGTITGRVDFAVYDTVTNPNEFVGTGGFSAPGTGRYVYAYQIFADTQSTAALECFTVVGIGSGAVTSVENIGAADDGTGSAVGPSDKYLNPSFTMATWEFGDVKVIADGHSWILLLRSNHDWTAGDYKVVEVSDGQAPIPNPEPATMALMGLGSSVLLWKRKKTENVRGK